MDPFLKYVPIVPALVAVYMLVRQVRLDVRAWRSAVQSAGTTRRPWWARSVLMAAVVILAWVPVVILQFQTPETPPQADFEAQKSTLIEWLKGAQQERDQAIRERDSAKTSWASDLDKLTKANADIADLQVKLASAQANLGSDQQTIRDLRADPRRMDSR
jgi:hypothetical protein